MTIDISGSAFPSHGSMGERVECGMTLRDYFAAKALSTFLLQPDCGVAAYDISYANVWAKQAYDIADAMLAERAK